MSECIARVKVLFFAKARELAGRKESELEIPASVSSSELKDRVIKGFNLESIQDIVILALNEEFLEPDRVLNLHEKDEIAVIPPLSGGSLPNKFLKVNATRVTWMFGICTAITYLTIFHKDKMANLRDVVRLEPSKLDINSIIESVVSPNCGAVSSFIGTTRDNFEQKKVVKLEYEAYEPMALKEMQAVCDKIRSKWNVEKIAIFHRLGEVPVTQASIVIAISSPHRQESLLAVQFAIDAVKTSVPIWKKEIYENADPIHQLETTCISSKKNQFAKVDNELVILNEETPDIDNICGTVEIETQSVIENDVNMQHDDVDEFVIDPDQVQIKADAKELNRRIESFISRKREQVNVLNMHGFCAYRSQIKDEDDESTGVCARVNAVFIRRHDSTHHVKVHRVYNQWSHQNIKPASPVKLEKESSNYPPALDERLTTTEKILGFNKPVPRDVYERIKKIEDRLLFLESISPEYRDLWSIDDCESEKSFDGNFNDVNDKIDFKSAKKRAHSPTETDPLDLGDRYVKKAK